MPYFLSDPTSTTYFVWVVVVIVAIAIAYSQRSRKTQLAAAVALGLLTVISLCDYFFESPRELAVQRVELMARDATNVAPEQFITNLSPSFKYKTADRDAIRKAPAWEQVRRYRVRVAVWGFAHDDTEYRGDHEVEIGFYAKAQTADNQALLRYVRMTFVRDPDGEFRVKTMQFFATGALNARTPEDIPGFP